MKKIGIRRLSGMLCLLIVLTVFCPVSVDAAESRPKTVRVGYFQMDGYHIQDESGHRSGYGYEFLQKISRYLPYQFEYVGYEKSWNEMQTMLENGEIDILTSAAKTPDREARFEYSRNIIGTNYTILAVKEGSNQLVARDYDTYNGSKIGLLNNSTKNNAFQEYAEEKGFTYVPVYYDDYDEMEQDLQSGILDGIVSSNLRNTDGEYILDQFNQNDFYVIAPKGNRTILDEIDHAIDELDLDEPGWRTALMYQSYYRSEEKQFSLRGDEQDFFDALRENHTVLKVLVNPDRKPYSYFEDGEAKGMIPAIFANLADTIGFSYEILETKDREEYYKVLESGTADICMDAAFDYSNAEETGYKLTEAYMSTGISQITKSGFNREIQNIAIMKNSSLIRNYIERYFSGLQFKYYDSIDACVDAVDHGEADAAFLYNYTVQDIINRDFSKKYASRLLVDSHVSFAIGVNGSCNPNLLKALNRAVIDIRETDVGSLILETTENYQESDSIVAFLHKHPAYLWGLTIAAGVFLVITGIAVAGRYTQRRLQLVNEQLNEANNAKREFLAKMSHDMRTPMNAIIGFTNIALKQKEPAEKDKCLEKIFSSSEYLLTLINDVLDISRIERGAAIYHPVPTNLCDVTESVLEIIQGFLTNRKLTLKVERPEKAGHCCVMADGVRIREILVNLLSNAVKFTDDGGTITFSMGTRPGADDKHIYIWYTISDTGCGMSEEYLPHVFEEFSQEENGARTQYKGSGLGMPITKQYVDLMSGTIEVKSKKGEGTTFSIELPVEVLAEGTAQNHAAQYSSAVDLNGKQVLLAEDNDLNAEIAIIQLEEIGLKVTRAVDGREAVELFAGSPANTYDVILMDIMMPQMNGYEAAKAIRKLDGRSDGRTIPIIALTANAFTEDIQKSLDSGMDAHIAKPLDVEKLIQTIAQFTKTGS